MNIAVFRAIMDGWFNYQPLDDNSKEFLYHLANIEWLPRARNYWACAVETLKFEKGILL